MKQVLLFCLCCLPLALFAQMKPVLRNAAPVVPYDPATIQAPKPLPLMDRHEVPSNLSGFQALAPPVAQQTLDIRRAEDGQVIQIRHRRAGATDLPLDALTAPFAEALELNQPSEELEVIRSWTDRLGFQHHAFRQVYQNVPVYGAELRLHIGSDDQVVLNGRAFPSPELAGVEPAITQVEIIAATRQSWESSSGKSYVEDIPVSLIGTERQSAELVIFFTEHDANAARLAWHVMLRPTVGDHLEYLLDAQTGEELRAFNSICHFHGHELPPPGPATAVATDLLGMNRTINTYESGGGYFLIDASRNEMFSPGQSAFPNEPVGVIWTIDGQNGNFNSSNFEVFHVVSGNNSWNNPTAVSAHYNGGKAFEYFLDTHERISINGLGGNIVSVINIEDENGPLDNAFWNGYAMFYGNGNTAFKPLARGLDVAGHEMSHGVIQSTANLEYFGESGALNESFADVFGAMIDRDDWRMGEDVVNLNAFPSGALRDLANPNQGGSGLSDPGWQPDHMDEKYTGSLDNGGVHINSGIPNRAFYLFADVVGKDDAEDVYYHALANYLVKSSQFIDCRLAVIQAASDLFGAGSAQVTAAQNAFSAVGIGNGQGGDYQDDLSANPGEAFLVVTTPQDQNLYLYDAAGEALADPLSTIDPLSRPSVTDDGVALVYVAQDQTMRVIYFDWDNLTYEEDILQSQPIWRNVAVSRDGAHLAALTDDYDNYIWIYDFGFPDIGWKLYELYNPTYTAGVETGNVLYPDFIEWDFAGEFVLYDAFNVLESDFGTDLEWWDIGFIKVWNNNPGYFAAGVVEKLFSGLPENTSVGNPTFAKNSDYILAFDFIDEYQGLSTLYAVNIQSGDQGGIFTNSILNVPNYTVDDGALTFNALDEFDNKLLAINDVQADKITPLGDAFIYLNNRNDGVWFANGFRILGLDGPGVSAESFTLQPNPTSGSLQVRWEGASSPSFKLEIVDILGRTVYVQDWPVFTSDQVLDLNLDDLKPGSYFVRIGTEVQAFIKQ